MLLKDFGRQVLEINFLPVFGTDTKFPTWRSGCHSFMEIKEYRLTSVLTSVDLLHWYQYMRGRDLSPERYTLFKLCPLLQTRSSECWCVESSFDHWIIHFFLLRSYIFLKPAALHCDAVGTNQKEQMNDLYVKYKSTFTMIFLNTQWNPTLVSSGTQRHQQLPLGLKQDARLRCPS